MKTKKWMCAISATAVMIAGSSCHEWGQMDPPAADDVYPTLENVSAYTFDDETLDPMLFKTGSYSGLDIPELYADPEKGQVLYLNNGYVTVNNPMAAVTCQNAVSMTFWMKQGKVEVPAETSALADEEEPAEDPQDLTGALIAFTNEGETGTMFFTANGWLSYSNIDGEWSENDPAQYETGYITPGEWHYVALIVRNDGYGLYVDGQRKVEKTVTDFDCSKMVKFMNKVSTLYIGKGSSTETAPWMIDDLKFYRNQITEKEIARPKLGGGSGGGPVGGDFEYVVGDPILNIGAPDCSTGWWTEFSNYYRLPAEITLHLEFINHTSGGGNWNNWNLCLSTDAERGGDGYAEYFVIRSDLYGWGDAYNGDNWSNTGYGDWDKFRADMEGARVTIDITREGAEVYVVAKAVAKDGTVYIENFHATCGDGSQIVRAFLIVDGSYLEMDAANCYIKTPVALEKIAIGAPDCSTGWWTEFSDYYQINPAMTLNMHFINHTSGGGNWNNWNLCLSTDAERGGDGYAEYFVIRSDLYGWGDSYNGDNWSNTGYGDWDKFRVDMEGADVTISIERVAAEVNVVAKAVAKDKTTYIENFHATCGDGSQIVRAFLIVDGSYLELDQKGFYLSKKIF